MRDGWIFAYGSLMWDPGMPVAEAIPARLNGWHRSFCLLSICHRGTPDRPGLVLGLDAAEDAVCEGMALRIAAKDWAAALATTRARELVTEAYREVVLPLATSDGRHLDAITYVMRRDHWQYAGGLDLDAQAGVIAAAIGGRGSNAAYLGSFLDHLGTLGIADANFAALRAKVQRLLRANAEKTSDSRPASALGSPLSRL